MRNFADLGALALVCDPNPGAAGLALKNDWEFETCPSVAEVLGNRDITAVAISTPAATHYSLAKEALQAGKDVFVEKPLALQVAQGEELVELAQTEGRILMVGHFLQYHPAVQQL